MSPAHNGEPGLSRQLVSGVLRYGMSQGRKEGRQTGELCKEIRSVRLKGLFFLVISCSSYNHTGITADKTHGEKMTLVVYSFLLSNIGHCQRGRGEGENVFGMGQE